MKEDPVTTEIVSPAVAGLGLGLALASTPGPVQAVLLAESVRGGIVRGFQALVGAHLTTGSLLVCVALGISFVPPSGPAVRVLKVVGGAFLLWLALEGFRSAGRPEEASSEHRTLPPAVRGSMAVLLNPGAWLFLGAVASSLWPRRHGRVGRGERCSWWWGSPPVWRWETPRWCCSEASAFDGPARGSNRGSAERWRCSSPPSACGS